MPQPRKSPPAIAEPLPRNVKLLGWASYWNDVASEMVFPLLPLFLISVLGGSRFTLGVIEGFADSLTSLLKLWSGGRSDRLGARKGFVVFGYAMAAVARPVIGLLAAPWQLFLVRTADRAGKGIRTSPRDALIADSTDAAVRGRAFGFQRGMDHLGAATGPLLAAAFLLIWPGELRWLFLLTLFPGLLVVLLVIFRLREQKARRWQTDAQHAGQPGTTNGEPDFSARKLGNWTLHSFDRRFKLYLVALVVFTLGNSTDAFLLVRAGELGVAASLLPILWCVFHVVKGAGSMVAGRLIDQWGPRLMILAGWFVYGMVYLGFGSATAAWHAWALFAVYAVFYALTEPAEKTLVANLVGEERRGLAYGWFNLAVGVSALPASLIFGWLYESMGSRTAFGWGAVLALSALLILTTLTPNVRPSPHGTK